MTTTLAALEGEGTQRRKGARGSLHREDAKNAKSRHQISHFASFASWRFNNHAPSQRFVQRAEVDSPPEGAAVTPRATQRRGEHGHSETAEPFAQSRSQAVRRLLFSVGARHVAPAMPSQTAGDGDPYPITDAFALCE